MTGRSRSAGIIRKGGDYGKRSVLVTVLTGFVAGLGAIQPDQKPSTTLCPAPDHIRFCGLSRSLLEFLFYRESAPYIPLTVAAGKIGWVEGVQLRCHRRVEIDTMAGKTDFVGGDGFHVPKHLSRP